MTYLLDTNALFDIMLNLNGQKVVNCNNNIKYLNNNTVVISEISTIEIYSVIGKYCRTSISQQCNCGRTLINGSRCEHIYVTKGSKKINAKVMKRIYKFTRDVLLNKNPKLKIKIININKEIIDEAYNLIQKALNYNFGSMDAMIAATAKWYQKKYSEHVTVMTADMSLKTALSEYGISVL